MNVGCSEKQVQNSPSSETTIINITKYWTIVTRRKTVSCYPTKWLNK